MIVLRAPGQGDGVVSAPESVAPRAPEDAGEPAGHACDFEGLVAQHLDFVWRLLRRFGLSPSDADDVAQRVFMIALQKLSELPPGKERMFLYGTARRLAANARRDISRRREVLGEPLETVTAPERAPDEHVDAARTAALLDELLGRMPEELSRVFVLAEVEGESVPAIAELENIPVGTAASRLRRARELFARLAAREALRNPFGAGR